MMTTEVLELGSVPTDPVTEVSSQHSPQGPHLRLPDRSAGGQEWAGTGGQTSQVAGVLSSCGDTSPCPCGDTAPSLCPCPCEDHAP